MAIYSRWSIIGLIIGASRSGKTNPLLLHLIDNLPDIGKYIYKQKIHKKQNINV